VRLPALPGTERYRALPRRLLTGDAPQSHPWIPFCGMRRVVPLLLTLTLAFSLAACERAGSVGPASGGHHVVAKAFCAFSAYALYRDVRAHRLGWAAFQAILAHHNCKQAFSRP
jgi:hypothetical protein